MGSFFLCPHMASCVCVCVCVRMHTHACVEKERKGGREEENGKEGGSLVFLPMRTLFL